MPKQFISLTGKEQRTLKTYEVTITETLQKTVTVEADSREEAERQVEESWNNSEYILDADVWEGEAGTWPAFNHAQLPLMGECSAELKFLFMPYMAQTDEVIACLKAHPEVVIISQSNHPNRLGEHRARQVWSQVRTRRGERQYPSGAWCAAGPGLRLARQDR